MAITISGSGITSANIADGTITTDDILASDVSSLKSGRKNLIINGAMDVWQRGTSTTSIGASYYTADRFWTYNPGSNSITQSSDVPSGEGFIYSLNFPTSINAFGQAIELPAQGKTMLRANTSYTVSFWAKADSSADSTTDIRYRNAKANGSGNINISANNPNTITTTWERHSFTFNTGSVAPASTNNILDFEMSVGNLTNFKITGVQLELGSVATDFEHRSYGEELALCQRYFQSLGGVGIRTAIAAGFTSTNQFYGYGVLKQTMRAEATVTISGGFVNIQYTHTNLSAAASANPTFIMGLDSYYITIPSAATSITNAGAYARIAAPATKVFFDAEL